MMCLWQYLQPGNFPGCQNVIQEGKMLCLFLLPVIRLLHRAAWVQDMTSVIGFYKFGHLNISPISFGKIRVTQMLIYRFKK